MIEKNAIQYQMKLNKIRNYELCLKLKLSHPTLKQYINNPLLFKCEHVLIMAKLFNVPVIDFIQDILEEQY